MKELYNIELENAILGAMIQEFSGCITQVSILKEDVFYKNENKIIFRAIQSIYKAGGRVDLLTVINEIKKLGVQEFEGNNINYYISKLTQRIASYDNIENHCLIIYQKYLERELKKLSLNIENRVNEYNSDCFEIIAFIENELKTFTSIASSNIKTIKELFFEIIQDQKNVLNGNIKTGIMSGIKNLDNVTGGWQNGNLIVIGARPGMGKSAFALQLAKYPAVTQNTSIGIFSLEMRPTELVGRILSSHTGINSTKINQKRLNAGEVLYMENNCDEIINTPIHFDGSSNLTINEFKNKARKLYYEKNVRLFIIDYLQYMTGSGFNKEQQTSDISRGLKSLAKELDCPVIVLCQLNRTVEIRPDKRPILSDLRDSGAIEQDADIVAFLYRPSYYDITEPYQYGNYILETENLLLIDIAKGRGLKTGEVPAKFNGETMTISNYELY